MLEYFEESLVVFILVMLGFGGGYYSVGIPRNPKDFHIRFRMPCTSAKHIW